MNSKRTFYLTVLALGVFAYIFFFERHTLDTQQRAERKMKLFPDFDAAKVTSVDIFLRSNGVIHVDQVIHILLGDSTGVIAEKAWDSGAVERRMGFLNAAPLA